MAHLILTRQVFTADDLTEDGTVAIDHEPNGRQSTIGSAFRQCANAGYIKSSGYTVMSRAKHRKGGRIQVWKPTDRGREWARLYASELPL